MIIDAHQHFWKYHPEDFGWIDDSMGLLKRDYLPGDLQDELFDADIEGTVAVQARQSLEETRCLLDLAAKNIFIKGVVGWVDLQAEDLDLQFEEFGGNPKLVGVRHLIQDEKDDNFILSPAFVRGIEKLKRYNLTYDLLLFPKHLPKAVHLVRMFPEQKFVLDHISKPFIKAGLLDPWRKDIETLAESPNVWCKISGMATEADLRNWKFEDFIPYLEVVTGAFGADRIMLGSDWPVCLLAGKYKEVLGVPIKFYESMDSVSKEKIFRKNCIDFYDLAIQ